MPSFPGGVSRFTSCFTLPRTVTVGLVSDVFTMSRTPLGNRVSVIFRSWWGTSSAKSLPAAQSGRMTGLVGSEVSFSLPPKPFEATGPPAGTGFKMPTTEFCA